MCYTHNSFSMLLITFYTFIMITFFVVKVVENFKKIVFINRFNFDSVKKVVYFFVAFLCVEIKIFVDFFLNNELVGFLIIFLNIIFKMNE